MRRTDAYASSPALRAALACASLAAVLVAAGGCSHLRAGDGSACEAGDLRRVRDTLYFGRNRPDGGTVDDAQWQAFLDQVVTSRFPDGLTVASATGQWRGASGKVETETAQVVTLLHAGDRASRTRIAEIVAEYKGRFRQEAVLRERSAVCASF